MATTVQPVAGESTKQLINYRTDAGVAVIEMNDPGQHLHLRDEPPAR